MKVAKFGGACFHELEGFERMVEVLREGEERTVVVASAVSGVTDTLVDFIKELENAQGRADSGEFIGRLGGHHEGLLRELVSSPEIVRRGGDMIEERLQQLERLLYGVLYTGELTGRTKDLILSTGERLSVILVAAKMESEGFLPRRFESDDLGLITDNCYGNARVLLNRSAREVGPLLMESLDGGEIPVITGFIGRSVNGNTTTLGRSGSDLTATALGYVLDAERIEIWKMVDGFLTADPSLVPAARLVPYLSYEEAAELSYFGAEILHPRSVEPARRKELPMVIRNLQRPDEPGTLIHADTTTKQDVVKSVSHKIDFCIVKAYGSGAGYRTGTMSEISGCIGGAGVNIYSATTSQTCVSFLIEQSDVDRTSMALEALLNGVIERYEVLPEIALVCIVGDGLAQAKGLASRVFRAVADADINVDLISAGASPVAFHFTVEEADLQATVRAIHREFFEGGAGQ